MKNIDIELEGLYKEDEGVRRAREKAMVFLSYGEHTVRSMYEKLVQSGFEKDDINEALSYLTERGYINEEAYFQRFCEYNAQKKGYGAKRILLMARAKGFSAKTINENAENVISKLDFTEICLSQLEKIRSLDLSDKKSKDKAIASLARRGFGLSEIKKAFAMYVKET